MSRVITAVGRQAIQQSASILGSGGSAPHRELLPGAQWRADRLLLSVDPQSVRFLVGNVLYREDLDGFLRDEFPSGAPVHTSRARWLAGLSQYEMPFCMGLASSLALGCDESISGCFFLQRFAGFFCNHRTQIELLARDLRYVLDGLFTLQQHPALYAWCMDSMGERARSSLPTSVTPRDVGAFLGRLVIGTGSEQISLAELPHTLRAFRLSSTPESEELMKVPHLRRMLETLEYFAERAAPQIDRLRSLW